jgi:hypothetical protein
LNKFFLKASKFQNKKGTFDVNLIFKATLACTKKVLFITKKGTLGPLKKLGGGGARASCGVYSEREIQDTSNILCGVYYIRTRNTIYL